jgi:XTP/dITP diphosphohydrolase
MTHSELLIATYNSGKLRELRELLGEHRFQLRDLHSFPSVQVIEETGSTFAENAKLKATGYAMRTGLMTLADDSGLEVSALDGLPGVWSARYAGDGASDAERVEKLLSELSTSTNRAAQFVCTIAIADCTGAILNVSTGVCSGEIAFAPRGENGFGYDPIFIPVGFDKTFAELAVNVKNQISHRARALKRATEFLRSLTAESRAG